MTSKCERDSVIKESRLMLYIALIDSHHAIEHHACPMVKKSFTHGAEISRKRASKPNN